MAGNEKVTGNWLSLAPYDLATALTESKARTILEATRELFEWIRARL
jgi:hypothetical protein